MLRYILLLVCFILLAWPGLSGCQPAAQNQAIFQDDFEKGALDTSLWEITSDGDFNEFAVEVIDVASGDASDYRLRLGANTMGTSNPLKYLGVRGKDIIDFSDGKNITFDLDWNNQFNGCYLTASLYLSPDDNNNPKNGENWLKFEYVGVPPGKNVRINVWEKVNGLVHELHTDWGPHDANGRPIGLPLGLTSHKIALTIDPENLNITQDGEEIHPLSEHQVNFTKAYLYLQISSGTNYPSREIYFDNIMVQMASSETQH